MIWIFHVSVYQKFSSLDRMCAKPLILIKKPLSRIHDCFGDGKRKVKESITNNINISLFITVLYHAAQKGKSLGLDKESTVYDFFETSLRVD